MATKYYRSKKGKQLRQCMKDFVGINDHKSLFDTETQYRIVPNFGDLDVVIQGWMEKRGGFNKNWKQRFFVLRNNGHLYYYPKENCISSEYYGVIAMNNIRSIYSVNVGDSMIEYQRKFRFDIVTHNRTYHLSCKKKDDLIDWMSVIDACIPNKDTGKMHFEKLKGNK